MAIKLDPGQKYAVKKMHNGCILNGKVGTGKSITAIAYYFIFCGGVVEPYRKMTSPLNLYIITTAKKRDSGDWEKELSRFCMSPDPKGNLYSNRIVIDSWNRIEKYKRVTNAFFIFDEQKVSGGGKWSDIFVKISKSNYWILLTATPGDNWKDYIPVFVANRFFRNKTQFNREHVTFNSYNRSYPEITGYVNTRKLERLRDRLLVDIPVEQHNERHEETVYAEYDKFKYKDAQKRRWDIYKNEPMQSASDMCYVLRKIVNLDQDRLVKVLEIFEKHPKLIIFYNFDAEREELLNLYYGEGVAIGEWSGHAHTDIPDTDKWVYLVQYTAGAEGWNAIKTDTILFYSQTYSYKTLEQAMGRIDRRNTPFHDLYYYHLKSHAPIDLAISKALRTKKEFNVHKFVGTW